MKLDNKQIIQAFGMEGEKTLETELTDKREKFLSKVDEALEKVKEALEVLSPVTTEEDTATDKVI